MTVELLATLTAIALILIFVITMLLVFCSNSDYVKWNKEPLYQYYIGWQRYGSDFKGYTPWAGPNPDDALASFSAEYPNARILIISTDLCRVTAKLGLFS